MIDIGESLMFTWLKHVEGCRIVQSNWRTSKDWEIEENVKNEIEQIVESAQSKLGILKYRSTKDKSAVASKMLNNLECDLLGYNSQRHEYVAVEVAFHGSGLHYVPTRYTACKNGIEYTANKVVTKLFSAAMALYAYLNVTKARIIFVSPFTSPAFESAVREAMKALKKIFNGRIKKFSYTFQFITNKEFKKEVLERVRECSSVGADPNELYIRSRMLDSKCIDGAGIDTDEDLDDDEDVLGEGHDANFRRATTFLKMTNRRLKSAIKTEKGLYEILIRLKNEGMDEGGWAQMGVREEYRRMNKMVDRPTLPELRKKYDKKGINCEDKMAEECVCSSCGRRERGVVPAFGRMHGDE